ncbi:MAG: trehalose-phosphatase [Silvanigrellales bacterium]|jgi:trehalose 6-phosphate phosphatase|nr:trehalose-phosphatase [Silvanigrellales bacterium]
MRNLFSPNVRPLLAEFCREPHELICAFDFDGTLAPIVAQPGASRMHVEVESRLRALAGRCSVVVISGRSVADLQERVRIPGIQLVGNHGMESPFVHEEALALSRASSETWRVLLEESGMKALQGVELENKTYSLALHYRHSPRRAAAKAKLVALAGGLVPLPRLVGGKEVLNLVHPALPHKGTALTSFQASLARRRSLYVGDDVTDEDVFALVSPELWSIRVGRGGASLARFFIPRQRDVRRLLDLLLELIPET